MVNTDFGILLKTLLDKSGINSELEQVQKIVNKYTIDIMNLRSENAVINCGIYCSLSRKTVIKLKPITPIKNII